MGILTNPNWSSKVDNTVPKCQRELMQMELKDRWLKKERDYVGE